MSKRNHLEKLLAHYGYSFPQELIAQAPVKPRDSAKLLVYNRRTGEKQYDIFRNLADYLPSKALLVLNETKVLPARLLLTKATGGRVRVLYLGVQNKTIEVLADRALKVGDMLTLRKNISFRVVRREDGHYFLAPNFPIARVIRVFEKFGTAPIPPYIKHSPLTEKKLMSEYQTVFARVQGSSSYDDRSTQCFRRSSAAPTASLHFTKRLLASLKKRGIDTCFVTLHVGLGTFAPLTEENIRTKKLHEEYYEIPQSTWEKIMRAKHIGRAVIPVGTTALRAIESAARNTKHSLRGDTNLFIREGYKFKIADGLVTNFHVPRSSLLMLVSAFAGRETILALYHEAIQKNYRLFSFGDGMLIL
jgi:S-adenosylmethionine:tRNA ribosyltransferase-isomerase